MGEGSAQGRPEGIAGGEDRSTLANCGVVRISLSTSLPWVGIFRFQYFKLSGFEGLGFIFWVFVGLGFCVLGFWV